VTVALDTPSTAGAMAATALESVIFVAAAADVRDVVAGGARSFATAGIWSLRTFPAALSAGRCWPDGPPGQSAQAGSG
jgi:hypothetical protein